LVALSRTDQAKSSHLREILKRFLRAQCVVACDWFHQMEMAAHLEVAPAQLLA
jgi:hypothetical protein